MSPSAVQVVLSYLPVGVWPREPHLHAATGRFREGGVLVGAGPDLLTHGLGRGENVGPFSALAARRAFVSA